MRPLLACLALILLGLLYGPAHADDLDIYGGQALNVPPNVLIILDNSSSMMCCVNDPCSGIPTNCANLADQRLYVAKNAIKGLVNRISGVNFGLMVFNSNSDGGRVVQWLGASKANVLSAIDSITTTRQRGFGGANATSSLVEGDWTFTPLAETLVEAGLYFAGANSEFNKHATLNSGTTGRYASPIANNMPCQKNYVIVVTDGAPTRDNAGYLSSRIGNYDRDDRDGNGSANNADELYGFQRSTDTDQSAGSDYLDDVAKYLHDNDCRPDIGSGEFEKQIVKTYTIGFTITNALLNDTSKNGGTGSTLTANHTAELDQRFNEILTAIQDANGIYASPAIPRSPTNQTDAGDKVYMAFFKPQANGRWIGNLKAFGLVNGVLKDAGTPPATATDGNGYILDTARSYWSTEDDGIKTDFGGAGKLLASNTSRNVYTISNTGQNDLTHDDNRFSTTNTSLTAYLAAETITNTLNGTSVKRSDNQTIASWRLGDIVHSEPVVRNFEATYQNGVIEVGEPIKSYLFVGANDGMLHVFNAANGSEAWAFVPPGQLNRLSLLTSSTDHEYFIDGSPVIEAVKKSDNSTMQLLVFGERRGGSNYYALDVTNPDQPVWKYRITDTLLTTLDWDGMGGADGTAAKLGLSWAKPQFKKVRSGSQVKEAFLLAGGYDADYDSSVPANPLGRAIYAVQADSADPPTVFGLNINAGNYSAMTHSILDVTGFDRSGYGYLDRIYAGDLGGNVFAARYNKCTNTECNNDGWEKMKLLDLPATLTVNSVTYNLGQKFMTKPEATIEANGSECVYFGTGDREHPNATSSVDAFYAICNKWEKDANGVLKTLTVSGNPAASDLVDVTDNLVQQGTTVQQVQVNAALAAGYGWYIRMPNAGEKIVSTPKILNKKIYFTTFTPGAGTVSSDPCTVSYDYGVSRLYVLDYRSGGAIYDYDANNALTTADRSIVIGTSIAAEPVLSTSGENTSLFVGSGGRIQGYNIENTPILRRYFWRQLK